MICDYLRREHPHYAPRHIVHAGAHFGEEAANYDAIGAAAVIWIEADPDTFRILSERLEQHRGSHTAEHRCVHALLSDRGEQKLAFHRFSNRGASSSLFRALPRLHEAWPTVNETGEVLELRSSTLDQVLEDALPDDADVDVLVLDLQGAELNCLKGARETLQRVRFLECEVSRDPIYDGGVVFDELNDHLHYLGFVQRTDAPWHGDVIYERPDLDRRRWSGLIDACVSATTRARRRILRKLRRSSVATVRSASGAPLPYDTRLLHRDAKNCDCEEERKGIFEFADFVSEHSARSYSQLAQDNWVAHSLSGLHGGFFVEVGAGNGIFLSNTLMLESEFGWRGICVEPGPGYEALRKRRSCKVDRRCVWRNSGERLTFCIPPNIELATIKAYASQDMHADQRQSGVEIQVDTVSLNDLLLEHEAPHIIDYMSIDTEGSEVDILECFDFTRYHIRYMTVEHNHTGNEARLDALMESNGFRRVLKHFSMFDAWYVNDTCATC